MFYFNEIKFRLRYFLLFFLLTIIIFSYYNDILFFLLLHKVTNTDFEEVEVFTFSNPSELFNWQIAASIYFSSLFLLPKLLFSFSDFFKSALTFQEYYSMSKVLALSSAIAICFNLFICLYFSPHFWVFSATTINASDLFLFELSFREYFSILESFILRFNFILFLIFFIFISLSFLELQIFFYLYRFYLFVSLLAFFFLTPIELHGSYLLICIIFFLEFIFFLNILRYKTHKYLKFLSRHYIK